MDLISKYLEKFKHIEDPKKNKEKIVSIINEFGAEISEKNIKILSERVSLLGVHPLVKNHIFMEKEKILEKINTELPKLKIKKIE